ncbi:unnamed protein product [Closterium sp. Naga37s-1]|nr:unnamed protein product [Closterium sp. Naga37s-1]
MGLHRYFGLSILLLVVTASFAITTARPVKDGKNKGGKGGPPDAGPCPLPKPKDAEALGNLTAILAARLNGSEVVGATGDVNATGRVCLAVFELDGDYNVFYSVVTSTSDDAEPFAASIYQGAAGEAGTAVHNTVAAGETATWANLTRPPPPPPKGKKNKGTPPAPPPPKYTYATNGTWLKASTLSTIGGQILKELVDSIISTPDGYYATFATTDYESGAARGQFQSDPLPPPPKGKKGGKDGGKKGGKDGGKKGGKDGEKNGGGKNGGDSFGAPIAVLEARVNGSDADLSGDVNATGCISFAVFRSPTTSDYNIKCHVSVALTDSGEPTNFVIKKGADVSLTMDTSSATWTNRTLSEFKRAKLGKQPPPPPLGYSYESVGAWLSASGYIADNGQTYKELMDAMLAAPDAYSALIYTKTFEAGAASGAFASVTKGGGEGHSHRAAERIPSGWDHRRRQRHRSNLPRSLPVSQLSVMRPPAPLCAHLLLCAPTCSSVPPPASLCPHLLLCAPTYFFVPPPASLCPHLLLCAPTCFSVPPPASLCLHLLLCAPTCFSVPPPASLCLHLLLCASTCFSVPPSAKTFENGAASGAFFYINRGGGD